MNLDINCVEDRSGSEVSPLQERYPQNPFCSPNYVCARAAMGQVPWTFLARTGSQVVGGWTAYLAGSAEHRWCDLPSADTQVGLDSLWAAFGSFLIDRKIPTATVNTYASLAGTLPRLEGERRRQRRHEYVVDLGGALQRAALSENHKRNVRRARRARLISRVGRDEEHCRAHATLVAAGRERRTGFGEDAWGAEALQSYRIFVACGAAEIHQVLKDDRPVASVLLLIGEKGAYYHSSGTTPDGRTLGAAHMLVDAIREDLETRGLEALNLAGADESMPGLQRFKAGFGARRVNLERVECDLRGPVERTVHRVRHWTAGLARRFLAGR